MTDVDGYLDVLRGLGRSITRRNMVPTDAVSEESDPHLTEPSHMGREEAAPQHERSRVEHAVSKVPALTLGFWVVKVAATTLGETGGDWDSMSLTSGTW